MIRIESEAGKPLEEKSDSSKIVPTEPLPLETKKG
jgi:hypothetical protein